MMMRTTATTEEDEKKKKIMKGMIFGIRVSSVGPGQISGHDAVHEPSNMDLAMKLHYLRAVYYFQTPAPFSQINVQHLKAHTFNWLQHFYITCGRLRRSDPSGRPYIKCNDCGVRFLEAQSSTTLDDWLQMINVNHHHEYEHQLLVPNQVIGPDLHFSPLVLIQVTKFGCGGVSVGLNWSHLLGDVYSLATFMNGLGSLTSRHDQLPPSSFIHQPQVHEGQLPPKISYGADPVSIKRVGQVGDHWAIMPHNHKMEIFTFQLTNTQISDLQRRFKFINNDELIPSFGLICAIIWKCVAQVRNGRPEPNTVTVCRKDPKGKHGIMLCNGQSLFVVDTQFSISNGDPSKLAALINDAGESGDDHDERSLIEEVMEREKGVSDFMVYGANLTFVDMEKADLYGFQLQGNKPTYVNLFLDSIGDDEGVVFVLPAPQNEGNIVTIMMPDSYAHHLNLRLKTELAVLSSN